MHTLIHIPAELSLECRKKNDLACELVVCCEHSEHYNRNLLSRLLLRVA
jgi:hypothetical protein